MLSSLGGAKPFRNLLMILAFRALLAVLKFVVVAKPCWIIAEMLLRKALREGLCASHITGMRA